MPTLQPASTMHQFYKTRAAEATREAGAAELANVRDRFLAAATTWTSLAARAQRVDRMNAGLAADRRVAAAELVAPGAHS